MLYSWFLLVCSVIVTNAVCGYLKLGFKKYDNNSDENITFHHIYIQYTGCEIRFKAFYSQITLIYEFIVHLTIACLKHIHPNHKKECKHRSLKEEKCFGIDLVLLPLCSNLTIM